MGVSRDEVMEWSAASSFDGPEARAPFTSLLFAPAAYTARWQRAGDISPGIVGVSAAVFADDGHEARGFAPLFRLGLERPAPPQALETVGRGWWRERGCEVVRFWGEQEKV